MSSRDLVHNYMTLGHFTPVFGPLDGTRATAVAGRTFAREHGEEDAEIENIATVSGDDQWAVRIPDYDGEFYEYVAGRNSYLVPHVGVKGVYQQRGVGITDGFQYVPDEDGIATCSKVNPGSLIQVEYAAPVKGQQPVRILLVCRKLGPAKVWQPVIAVSGTLPSYSDAWIRSATAIHPILILSDWTADAEDPQEAA